jgi:tight adherence protein B
MASLGDSRLAASLLLGGIGLALLPPCSGAGRRLAWLAARRWPHGSVTAGRPATGRARRLWSALAERPPITAAGLALASGLLAGPAPALLAAVVGVVLGYCWRRVRAERALASETAALSEAVAAIVAEHAAGATLAAALRRAAPSAGRHEALLQQAARLASLGQPPAAALTGEPALARIAVAAALVGRSGVSVDEVLRGVRRDLRSELRARAAVAEAVAGARSSALLLTALPVAGLAMGIALGAHPQRVLLHTGPGLVALSAGVLLNLTGLCWVLRLTELGPTATAPRPSAGSPRPSSGSPRPLSGSMPPSAGPSAGASPAGR